MMRWNNGYERKKFEKEQQKLAEQYRAAGMTEEAIREMHAFDLEVFRSDRRFYEHTQPLICCDEEFEEEGQSPLCKRFIDAVSTEMAPSQRDRFWWIDEIEDSLLASALTELSDVEKEFISLLICDGYSQREIAREILCISDNCVYRRICRIRRRLKTSGYRIGGAEDEA